MKHLPNILTALRLVLAVAMFGCLIGVSAALSGARMSGPTILLLVRFATGAFVVAAVTDFFDGWLARRWGAVSVLGAILDPIADKILVCGAILGIIAVGVTPEIVLFSGIILFREFAVSALREVMAPKGIKLPVTPMAKFKTTLQLVGLGALMILKFWPAWGIDADMGNLRLSLQGAEAIYGLAALLTLWTGLEYGRAAWRALSVEG
jgi:CDP-diacylglycerol--glycerol-3-phosphate 3-phosphatidyltransferase